MWVILTFKTYALLCKSNEDGNKIKLNSQKKLSFYLKRLFLKVICTSALFINAVVAEDICKTKTGSVSKSPNLKFLNCQYPDFLTQNSLNDHFLKSNFIKQKLTNKLATLTSCNKTNHMVIVELTNYDYTQNVFWNSYEPS